MSDENAAMRVTFVTPYYYPAICFGGPVWSTRALVRGLVNAGVEVRVHTTTADRPKDSPPRVEMVDGATVYYHRRVGTSSWCFSPSLAAALARETGEGPLMHLAGVWSFPSTFAAVLASLRGVRYLIAPRGTLDPWALHDKGLKKSVYLRLLARRNLRGAWAVHCLSEREMDQVHAQVPEAKCVVIPNAVGLAREDVRWARSQRIEERFPELTKKKVVLFLSRIHPKKGLDVLVPAFARLRTEVPDAHLVIAGPDENGYRESVERMVVDSGIEGNVTFSGMLGYEDKLSAYAAADVFVLPSYSEGVPMVVLEAMAFGLPVVISEQCNLTRLVEDSRVGLVVETSVDGVAGGLRRILCDEENSEAMSARAREVLWSTFSPEVVTNKLLRLLEVAKTEAES